MSNFEAFQSRLLERASEVLCSEVGSLRSHSAATSGKLQILEEAACIIGGHSVAEFRRRLPAENPLPKKRAAKAAGDVVQFIANHPFGINPALALAALGSLEMHSVARKQIGSYYTDFRLAQFLLKDLSAPGSGFRILDPACGSGMLLVAALIALAPNDVDMRNAYARDSLFGADVDPAALRACRLAIGAMTPDIDALETFGRHLMLCDSLMSDDPWKSASPTTHVVSNPPWEKVAISRHEYLVRRGIARHYGSDYSSTEMSNYDRESKRKQFYAEDLRRRFGADAKGEINLYVCFMQKALECAAQGAELRMIVPAGLIRSAGTESLRRKLFTRGDTSFTIFDNRHAFFSIDSRTKFLLMNFVPKANPGQGSVVISYNIGNQPTLVKGQEIRLATDDLGRLRADLTVPEVRNNDELALFVNLSRNGRFIDENSNWLPCITREVDMTKHRPSFRKNARFGALPVLEGRAISHFRHDAKSYVSGAGRAARWSWNAAAAKCMIKPQFYIDENALSESGLRRAWESERVGFCDIGGQTNERTFVSSVIPAGVVCGNKVPTIRFESTIKRLCFVALSNSFIFDWLIRRLVTTSLNYFILHSVPVPQYDATSFYVQRLAQIAGGLNACEHLRDREVRLHGWDAAENRSVIDVLVAEWYGLTISDLDTIMRDFPLLDRYQAPLLGEDKSTITRDYLVYRYYDVLDVRRDARYTTARERYNAAVERGAIAYVPSEYARDCQRLR